jgi:ATP-dependent Zn protease
MGYIERQWVGLTRFLDDGPPGSTTTPRSWPSATRRAELEREVRAILEAQRTRARHILEENRALVKALRDLLLEKKVLDEEPLATILPKTDKPDPIARET